jgi:hypothetical protein
MDRNWWGDVERGAPMIRPDVEVRPLRATIAIGWKDAAICILGSFGFGLSVGRGDASYFVLACTIACGALSLRRVYR